jgi:DegV family protein with EDD domain
MSIKIYCDAGSNLYPAILKIKNADINVFPMNVVVDNKTYRCYEDNIDVEAFSKEFYESLNPRKKNVHTSLVSVGEYQKAFSEEVDKGNQVVCFTLAKGISGTYNAARLAADAINESAGKEVVHIVNSATAGLGEGMQALRAYEDVKAGKKSLVVLPECDSKAIASLRNIEGVKVTQWNTLSVYDILGCDTLVAAQDAVNKIQEVYNA